MRKYIRHPSDIPIDFQVSDSGLTQTNHLVDVSLGGLCFMARSAIKNGTRIHITIPVNYSIGDSTQEYANEEEFEGDGIVSWCLKNGAGYTIGVQFEDSTTQFGVRMVEQVCHIEHYRYDMLHSEGRQLSSEEAAKEWVELFAAEFPSVS